MEDSQRKLRPKIPWQLLSSHYAFIVLFLFAVLINLAIRLLNLPLNRIIELRYCVDYYLEHDPSLINSNGEVDELLCKVDEVQQKLAWLEGFIGTSIVLCG